MIAHKKALAKVLDKQWLDLTTPMGKGLLAFLSTPAEDELLRMTRRANEGREGASHFPVASQRARNSKRKLMLIAAIGTLGRSLPDGTDTNDFVLERSYRNQREVLVLAHSLGFGVYGNTVQMLENAKHWEDVGYEVISGTFQTGSTNVVERRQSNSPSILNSPESVPVVEIKSVANLDDEVELAAQEVKKFIDGGLAAHQIMIVSLDDRSARRYFSAISVRLNEWSIPCNNIIRDKYSEPPFRIDGMVTMSTVYRAKGNEAAVVIVIGSDAATLQTRTGRNKLFVALTRTKAWLRIYGVETSIFASLRTEVQAALGNAPRISFEMPDMNTLNTIQRGLEEKHARIIEAKRRLGQMQSELNLSDDDMGSLIED